MSARFFHEAGARLTLVRRGPHYELRIDHAPILTSALLGTERDFGRLAPERARRVLVGGLGFGSTVAGVLEKVGPSAEVIVAEKLETVIRLVSAGGELAHLAGGALDDPRVQIVRADAHDLIARERDLDAILLDVDNGPDWASFRANARLYDARGLAAAHRALARGGIYAVWSGYPADAFVKRLARAGFRTSIVPFVERRKVQARAYVGKKR